MVNLPKEYFTPESILTLTGATGAVYVVCGGLQHAFRFNPRWLALAISLILALVGAQATQSHEIASYLVAIVNGFLIYCTAVGVNSVLAPPADGSGVAVARGMGPGGRQDPPRPRSFLSRWV
jgi:hypothetical protein